MLNIIYETMWWICCPWILYIWSMDGSFSKNVSKSFVRRVASDINVTQMLDLAMCATKCNARHGEYNKLYKRHKQPQFKMLFLLKIKTCLTLLQYFLTQSSWCPASHFLSPLYISTGTIYRDIIHNLSSGNKGNDHLLMSSMRALDRLYIWHPWFRP